jgi:hypothetical protein
MIRQRMQPLELGLLIWITKEKELCISKVKSIARLSKIMPFIKEL